MTMASPPSAPGLLGAVWARLEDSERADVNAKWEAFVDELEQERIKHEKESIDKDNRNCAVEQELQSTRHSLEKTTASLESLESQVQSLNNKIRQKEDQLESHQEISKSLQTESSSLKKERERVQSEMSELSAMAERRRVEVEHLQKQLSEANEQLQVARADRIKALANAEEVEAKRIGLDFKEKRWQEQLDYMQLQVQQLQTELSEKSQQLLLAKTDEVEKMSEMKRELSNTKEILEFHEEKEEALKTENKELQKNILQITEKLKASREEYAKMEDTYRQELKAQRNLAELYKGQCNESASKSEDMAKAVQELQKLLNESTERYGQLETKIESQKTAYEEDIERRNVAIRGLRKELEHAHQLIKTLEAKGISEEGIEKLSPSAAAASKILKSGTSLTQIYSQLVSCQEELINTKEENTRLNAYIDQMVAEIEANGPAIKKCREDYDVAIDTVNKLTSELANSHQEQEFRKREAEESRLRVNTMARENQRLLRQVQDLSKQVTVLVKEVEASRGNALGRSMDSNQVSMEGSSTDADSVIEERLLVFRDVEELQRKNLELVSVVRELSRKQEDAEQLAIEQKTAELKSQLEIAGNQIEELREARRRQEVMVESIITERDMYKSIVTRANASFNEETSDIPMATSTPQLQMSPKVDSTLTRSSLIEMEKRAAAAEKALEELKEELQTYRTEKCENERLINEELSKYREELTESRAKVIKLSSQEEFNAERLKALQATNQAQSRQLDLLEEKSRKLNDVIAKHEESSVVFRKELLASQSKVSHLEVQVNFLKHENGLHKSAEQRLVSENEMLRRQQTTASLMHDDLSLIKTQLEKAETEKLLELTRCKEALEREVELLNKKRTHDQEETARSLQAWEASQRDLNIRLDTATKQREDLKEKNFSLLKQIDELKAQLNESQDKLELAESTLAGKGVVTSLSQGNGSGTELSSSKVRDLQLQLNQSRSEALALKEKLNSSKQALNQYKEIAESAEKRLSESSNAAKALKEDLENRLKTAEEGKVALEKKLAEVLEESDRSRNESLNTNESERSLKIRVQEYQDKVQVLEAKVIALGETIEKNNSEIKKHSQAATEAHNRYERELVLHAQDVDKLNKLKTELSEHQESNEETVTKLKTAEDTLAEMKENIKQSETLHQSELEQLKEQFSVVEKENASLHERLSTLSQQMSSLQQHQERRASLGSSGPSQTGSGDLANISVDASNSSDEQFMSIIKFLRREKEILTSKCDVLKAEMSRLKSQLEYKSKQLEDVRNELQELREGAQTSVISSSKYAELMERVQTVHALSDSNRMLREEKLKLENKVEELASKLKTIEDEYEPTINKLKSQNEREELLQVELKALKADNSRWKARANQLIEKQQQVNPDELKRLQTDNSNLTKQLAQVQQQMKQLNSNVLSLNNKNKAMKEEADKANELANKRVNDIKRQAQQTTAKLSSSTARITELDTAKQTLEKQVNQMKVELEQAKVNSNETQTRLSEKTKELEISQQTLGKVRGLGRSLKEKNLNLERELAALKTEKNDLEKRLQTVTAESAKTTETGDADEQLKQAEELLTQATDKISELEEKLQDIQTKKEEVETKAREMLSNARGRIKDNEQTIKELKEENEALKELQTSSPAEDRIAVGGNELFPQLKNEVEQLKQERDDLKREAKEVESRLSKQIETLKRELNQSRSSRKSEQSNVSLSAVADPSETENKQTGNTQQQSGPEVHLDSDLSTASNVGSSSSQQQRNKQTVHPQVHIAPTTRHTATIRPHAIRTTSASPASQTSNNEVRQVSVQPISVVAPTTSSNAASLNPNASEFVPRVGLATEEQSSAQQSSPMDDSLSMPAASSPRRAMVAPSTATAFQRSVIPQPQHQQSRVLNRQTAAPATPSSSGQTIQQHQQHQQSLQEPHRVPRIKRQREPLADTHSQQPESSNKKARTTTTTPPTTAASSTTAGDEDEGLPSTEEMLHEDDDEEGEDTVEEILDQEVAEDDQLEEGEVEEEEADDEVMALDDIEGEAPQQGEVMDEEDQEGREDENKPESVDQQQLPESGFGGENIHQEEPDAFNELEQGFEPTSSSLGQGTSSEERGEKGTSSQWGAVGSPFNVHFEEADNQQQSEAISSGGAGRGPASQELDERNKEGLGDEENEEDRGEEEEVGAVGSRPELLPEEEDSNQPSHSDQGLSNVPEVAVSSSSSTKNTTAFSMFHSGASRIRVSDSTTDEGDDSQSANPEPSHDKAEIDVVPLLEEEEEQDEDDDDEADVVPDAEAEEAATEESSDAAFSNLAQSARPSSSGTTTKASETRTTTTTQASNTPIGQPIETVTSSGRVSDPSRVVPGLNRSQRGAGQSARGVEGRGRLQRQPIVWESTSSSSSSFASLANRGNVARGGTRGGITRGAPARGANRARRSRGQFQLPRK